MASKKKKDGISPYDNDELKKIVETYYLTFSCPTGMAVLEDMKKSFLMRSSIVPGDPHMTYANEGSREVVLKIIRLMEMYKAPVKATKIMTEENQTDGEE